MIPQFDEYGNLPPGIYDATEEELEQRFAITAHRRRLWSALTEVLGILAVCGCREAYLNGSFITSEPQPNDYDLCWEPTGVTATAQLKELLSNQETRKERHYGDIFVRMPQPPYYFDHVEDWQTDRDGNAKGIIRIRLRHNR